MKKLALLLTVATVFAITSCNEKAAEATETATDAAATAVEAVADSAATAATAVRFCCCYCY